MFDNEGQDEELKAFEASLGSLRPRVEGLDRRWRSLLAQEAAFNGRLSEAEVLAAGGSVCCRCGGATSSGRPKRRRWAWPTALSGMSAVAAILLAMLVLRSAPQDKAPGGGSGMAAPLASSGLGSDGRSVGVDGVSPSVVPDAIDAPYLSLRDQVLQRGVDSWKQPPSESIAVRSGERPLGYREQLDRLLVLERFHGS